MSVHQLKDGRWIVQYRDGANYKREYFGRGLEAETKARARNDELAPRPYKKRTQPKKSPLFEDLANAYLIASRATTEDSTREILQYKLSCTILPELGSLYASRITHYRMDQYVARRLDAGRKKSTIHREITDIQAILNWAAGPDRGYIEINPLAGYKKPPLDDEIIQPVTHAEITRILTRAVEHLIKALIISYYTGLRPGKELFGLKWTDMDWDQEMILIRSARKKGPPFRFVPVHRDFLGHLKAWYKNDGQQDVHIIRYNGKPIKSIKRSFAHAKKKAGITRRLRPYDFRHAFATWVLGEGADLKSTSEILGHSSTKITTRVYQHTNMAMRREVINKLPVLEVPKIEKKVSAAK